MDNQQKNTNSNQPQYLSKDNSNDVLNNLDISTTPVTMQKPVSEAQMATEAEGIGYSSPYANKQNINLTSLAGQQQAQATSPAPAPQAQLAAQEQSFPQVQSSTTPVTTTQTANQIPASPTPFPKKSPDKPNVVYEKTIVEKGPSLFATIFAQIFKLIGCFLFAAFIVIAAIVYAINF